MKYIKKYENIDSDIKVGDYVLINAKYSTKVLKNFIDNTIGQLTKIDQDSIIIVKYTNIPIELGHYFSASGKRVFDMESIVDYDEDIEKLKLKLAANKYNI